MKEGTKLCMQQLKGTIASRGRVIPGGVFRLNGTHNGANCIIIIFQRSPMSIQGVRMHAVHKQAGAILKFELNCSSRQTCA